MGQIYAEEIIKSRRSAKEDLQETREQMYQVENDIEHGYVVVRYKHLELKEMSIMDGRAIMLLPESFKEMPEELAAIKYPDPDRPEWILSDEEGEVTLTLHLEEGEIEEGELEDIAELLEKEMKYLYPASVIEKEQVVGEDSRRVCWFSLDIPLVDDKCCHVMFFREMDEGMLMGTFNCSRDGKKQWKPVLSQLFATIREGAKKDESGSNI